MCWDEREWDHCLKNAPAGSKSITTLMVSLTIDNYRNNRLQVNHAVRWNAIRRYDVTLWETERECGYGYQFQCRCICGQLVYTAVCEPYFSKCVYLRLCVFVAGRWRKAPARQWCTAITHSIMTPVRHGIRHQLCLRLLAGRAAGVWAGRDEKTKAKHGAHVTGRSCRWVKGNYKRAHTPADNSLLSARADI